MRTVTSGDDIGQESSIQKSWLVDGTEKKARAERGATQQAGWAEPRFRAEQ